MIKISSLGIVCIVMISFLNGCAGINATRNISNLLIPEDLNYKMETPIIDLSIDGKCPGTRSINVINSETRIEKYCINDTMGCRWYIIPKDFTDYVVKYTEDKLIESNVTVDEGAGDKILVSLEEVKAIEGMWSFGSSSKIKIQIPEITYTQIYNGDSGSGLGFHAVAYAIHVSIDEFINDSVFQDYIKCQ